MYDWLRGNYLGLIFIALVALVAYSNSFMVPFVYDDWGGIVNNEAALGSFDFLRINSFLGLRSLAQASLALNYQFGGLEVWHYHAVNLALHIANGWLVFWLALSFSSPHTGRGAGRRGRVALFAALIFVAHPLATEAVTYVSQRAVLLATMFYLIAVVGYVKFRTSLHSPLSPLQPRAAPREAGRVFGSAGWAALSIISTLAAMHSKQIAATIPVVIIWVELCLQSRQTNIFGDWRVLGKSLLRALPWLLLLAYIPWKVFGALPAAEVATEIRETGGRGLFEATQVTNLGEAPLTAWEYRRTQSGVWLQYLRLYMLPAGQSVDHDFAVVDSIGDWRLLSAAALAASLIYLTFWAWRRQQLISLGVGWFFITLAVESVFPLLEAIAEYRLYLPSVGLALAVAGGLMLLSNKVGVKQWGGVASAVLIVLLTFLTWQRNLVWQDPVRLWQDAIRKAPDMARPYNNLGFVLLQRGETEQAAENFERAIAIKENYAQAQHNLGTALAAQGKTRAAIVALERALEIDPKQISSAVNLATLYLISGQLHEAEQILQPLLERSPGAPLPLGEQTTRAYTVLGAIYVKQGKLNEARRQFESALEIDPGYESARRNLELTR